MANLDQYTPYVDAVGNAAMNFAMADLSYKKNKKLLQQQYKYQKEAADLAWQRQMQFYEDQKAYNDPNAVRQRYEAAGLNVNAAFGTAGSYSPTNAPSSVQPAGGVSTPYVDYTNMKFQSALGLAKQMAEIDLIKAQADETRGRTLNPDETQRGQKLTNDLTALNARLTDANIIGKDLANKLDSLDLRFRNEVYDTSVAIERQKALNLAKQYEVMNEDIARSLVDLLRKISAERFSLEFGLIPAMPLWLRYRLSIMVSFRRLRLMNLWLGLIRWKQQRNGLMNALRRRRPRGVLPMLRLKLA
mgnify:CR=1 FL=1